jgi:outer membrane protein OmpA-like peptidoglycan-associated protein
MQFKVLDIFNMKRIITAFACLVLFGLQAQTNREQYAAKLSSEYRFAEALPVWEELSSLELKKTAPKLSVLRKTVEAAYASEAYSKAMYWSGKLTKKSKFQGDWIMYMKAVKYMNKPDRVSAILDSALNLCSDKDQLLNIKDNLPLFYSNVKDSSEYQIRKYHESDKGEVYGAFPNPKGGILFVSNEYNHVAVNRNYPRTGQYYSDVAFYDSIESTKTYKFYQKPFWIDFFYKNRWRDYDKTRAHDGPVSFNPDNTMMFVTTNYNEKDKEDSLKYRRLKQLAFYADGDVLTPVDFPFNSIQFSTGHAIMDAKGTVYFVSNRPGSMIKSLVRDSNNRIVDTIYSSDIWKTTFDFDTEEWSAPVNLGDKVNTSEDELFPFISNWGNLYFSSHGWNSIGGLDVFVSELDGNEPTHIGAPLNSAADDFSYYVDEETGKGYFSSNRESFVDKIYAFNKPVFKADLKVNLADCKGNGIKSQIIMITDLQSNKMSEIVTNDKGQSEAFELVKNHEYRIAFKGTSTFTADTALFKATEPVSSMVNLTSYFKQYFNKLTVTKEVTEDLSEILLDIYRKDGNVIQMKISSGASYIWNSQGANAVDSILMTSVNCEKETFVVPKVETGNCVDTIPYNVALKSVSEENFLRLEYVLYNFDKSFLRPEGKAELDKLVNFLNSNPNVMRVELESHTDSRGSDKYNLKLSQRRAKSCYDYLISKGISKNRIKTKGFGETKLKNECSNGVYCTKEKHQANRRTELILVTKDNAILDNNKLEDRQN